MQDRQRGMCFRELSARVAVEQLARLLALDDTQPFALELRHGRRAAHDVEPVVDQPDKVIEVTMPVFRVA